MVRPPDFRSDNSGSIPLRTTKIVRVAKLVNARFDTREKFKSTSELLLQVQVLPLTPERWLTF